MNRCLWAGDWGEIGFLIMEESLSIPAILPLLPLLPMGV